jgi:protein-S-isoprenylcysteine O-methyltransferase Ste14
MIHIGNFFFRTRNYIFPLIMVALFAIAPPPERLLGSEMLEHASNVVAVLLALLGLALRSLVIGFVYIKRGGLNKQVYAESLVTSGIFALSRNPLYVGNLMIYAGVFLLHGNWLVMVLGYGLFLVIYRAIVAAEEAYLRGKFGEAYDRYCMDVPRWWPQWSQFSAATEGMRFDARKAFFKDYSTMTTTFITLLVVQCYHYVSVYSETPHPFALFLLVMAMVACGFGALFIRIYKKRAARAIEQLPTA